MHRTRHQQATYRQLRSVSGSNVPTGRVGRVVSRSLIANRESCQQLMREREREKKKKAKCTRCQHSPTHPIPPKATYSSVKLAQLGSKTSTPSITMSISALRLQAQQTISTTTSHRLSRAKERANPYLCWPRLQVICARAPQQKTEITINATAGSGRQSSIAEGGPMRSKQTRDPSDRKSTKSELIA